MRRYAAFLVVFIFVVFPSLTLSTLLDRDTLDVLSRRPVEKAKCRSVCMTAHKIGSTSCLGDCQKCWDFCEKFSAMPRGSVAPDCDANRGCVTARNAFFGRDDKEKNRVRFGSQKFRHKVDIKFPEKPEFRVDSCVVIWRFPETDRNAIPIHRSKWERNVNDVVYIVFGKDWDDRWYEIGQTSKTEMKILPEVASKMSVLRLMGVTSGGVFDETSVTPAECRSPQQTVSSRLESPTSDESGGQFPSDPYFLPLVAVCVLLGLACISVTALIIRSNCSKPNKRLSESTSATSNLHNSLNLHNNNNKNNNNLHNNNNNNAGKINHSNASIEIFEEVDPSLRNSFSFDLKTGNEFETGSGSEISKTEKQQHVCQPLCVFRLQSGIESESSRSESSRSESSRSESSRSESSRSESSRSENLDSKLNAHVCYSKCGLGPEYLKFVKNTNL